MYLPRNLISHLYTNLVKSHHPLSPPVLLLVALDPDALCACRILAALLKRDYIPHKIQPISGYADLSKAGEDLVRPMKTTQGGSGGVVVCLGVGGLVDLGSLLGLETDESEEEAMGGVEVWVLDARRPWNLANVFGGMPIDTQAATTGDEDRVRPRLLGVDKGCLQRSYKSGKGGIIVFDDGDITGELDVERDAYCALAEMPEVEADSDSDDDDDDENDDSNDEDSNADDEPTEGDANDEDGEPKSKKRKSWSDHDEDDDDSDEDDQRPRQRRRANSGSSISSSPRSRTPTSSQPTSPTSKPHSPKPKSAKQLRRRLKKLRRTHEKVLDQYYNQGLSYSEPISTLAYSLASELGREDNDLLWMAIVGVTSLELSGYTSTGFGKPSSDPSELAGEAQKSWRSNRSRQTYAILRDETRRLNPPPKDQSPSVSPASGVNSPSDTSIRLTPDPRFLLLRHWSLYDSMLHSPYLASRLRIWNEHGVKRLHKLLAKMGVSLNQCKQTYTHMDMDLKKTLRERLLKYAPVYGLDDLVPSGAGRYTYDQEGWGFIRSWGWKAQLSAFDVGLILGAILDVGTSINSSNNTLSSSHSSHSQANQHLSQRTTQDNSSIPERSATLIPRFFAAYDALAPNHPTQLLASVPQAQHLLRAILRTGSSLLVKHQIRHLRAFRMGVVKDGPDLPLFASSPGALVKLALWVGEAVAVNERERDRDRDESNDPTKPSTTTVTPLVLAALDEARGTYVVVGTGGSGQSNRFGLAFQEVVEETDARVKIDSFDHSIVEVRKEDLAAFLEALSLKAVVG